MRRSDKVIATILLGGFIALILSPFTFFAIHPGQVGVLYHLFGGGTVTNFVYTEGVGVKWPWNTIYRYEVRTQALHETVHALASDGLSVEMDATVLFHPIPHEAGRLHKEVGPDYAERIVRPIVIEAVRDIIGKYGPHELYRFTVDSLEQQVLSHLKAAPLGLIHYDGVVLRKIVLPKSLNDAITNKLTEEQNAHTYDFLIVQAEKEAARKRVEAIGIQTFYSIVANALSPQLLTWRGIEATVQIARSPNSKVVIVGGSKDQLPLILGSDISQQPSLPAPPAIDPDGNKLPNFEALPSLFPNLSSEAPGNKQMRIEPSRTTSSAARANAGTETRGSGAASSSEAPNAQ